MAEVTSIHPADLRAIENNLNAIHQNISVLNDNINIVDGNIQEVNSQLEKLTDEFHEFVALQTRANARQIAHTELIRVRQELEQKFGHYGVVRRTTIGILQATDVGIVKKDTISNASEELMLSTPRYWLAPCLVSLSAWINNKQELSEKALREAIHRNDEKTSLFFTLVCRRANRKSSSLKWAQRYLANQNEEALDRKAIIILDAYASGLLGIDTEGLINKQMQLWLDRLTEKPGFIDKQTRQWSKAISLQRLPLPQQNYPYLQKYSNTWPNMQDTLEGAYLHENLLKYFTAIFNKETSTASLKEQLDDTLESLVTDFDDEELPLREEEKLNQLIIKFDGDKVRANKNMQIEKTAFETHKDFTQLLTDAAMNPDIAHASPSTQKFAISLSKEWITNAYNDLVAKNRMHVPNQIDFTLDEFNGSTTDGDNEMNLIIQYNSYIDQKKAAALENCKMSKFVELCRIIGPVTAVLGLLLMFTGSTLLGILLAAAGAYMFYNNYITKAQIEKTRQELEVQYEEQRKTGTQIIRAILAEVVDYRAQFAEKDAESQQVLDFLEQINPEQYIIKQANSTRHINVN